MKLLKKTIIMLLLLCTLFSCKEYYLIKKNNLDDGLYAHLETTKGNIIFRLEYEETPLTVSNFIHLSRGTLQDEVKESPYYDGAHLQVDDNIEIQTDNNPGYIFAKENYEDLKNEKPGIIAFINSNNSVNGASLIVFKKGYFYRYDVVSIFGKVVNDQSLKLVESLTSEDKIEKITILKAGDKAKSFVEEATTEKLIKAVKIEEKRLAAEAERRKQERLIHEAVEQREKELKEKYLIAHSDYRSQPKRIHSCIEAYEPKLSSPRIRYGHEVTINYTIKHPDGRLLDSTNKEPLNFVVGDALEIPYFNEVIQDMTLGQKRFILIDSDRLYGKTIEEPTHPDTWLRLDIEVIGARFKIEENLDTTLKLKYIHNNLIKDKYAKYKTEEGLIIPEDKSADITIDKENQYISIIHLPKGYHTEEHVIYLGNKTFLYMHKNYPAMQHDIVLVDIEIYNEKDGYLYYQEAISNVPIEFDLFVSEEEKKLPMNLNLFEDQYEELKLEDYIGYTIDHHIDHINKKLTVSIIPFLNSMDTPEEIFELSTTIESRKYHFMWDIESNLFVLQ